MSKLFNFILTSQLFLLFRMSIFFLNDVKYYTLPCYSHFKVVNIIFMYYSSLYYKNKHIHIVCLMFYLRKE